MAANAAFRELNGMPLDIRKDMVAHMRQAGREYASILAEIAVEETGMGRVEDKVLKNILNADKTQGPEVLETGEFIGFIGLAYQDYETEFTPATDIGWRLKKSAWGNGYATEGARRCLEYAFKDLKLDKIISTCTLNNTKSENVMRKIGMSRKGEFNHPRLKDYPAHEKCSWYETDHV